MGKFNKSNLTTSWANGDTIKEIERYYNAAQGETQELKIRNAIKSMFNDIEGVDGDTTKNSQKYSVMTKGYEQAIDKMAKNIVSATPDKTMHKICITIL